MRPCIVCHRTTAFTKSSSTTAAAAGMPSVSRILPIATAPIGSTTRLVELEGGFHLGLGQRGRACRRMRWHDREVALDHRLASGEGDVGARVFTTSGSASSPARVARGTGAFDAAELCWTTCTSSCAISRRPAGDEGWYGPCAEHDVGPRGERVCADGPSRSSGVETLVHAHPAEVEAELRFHVLTRRAVECLRRRAQAALDTAREAPGPAPSTTSPATAARAQWHTGEPGRARPVPRSHRLRARAGRVPS